MDIGDVPGGQPKLTDDIGIQIQKLFQDFLQEFKENDEVKYLNPAKELTNVERNTLEVSFEDIEKYNQQLATTIVEEYYRVHEYLCRAIKNFVKDKFELSDNKEFYIALTDVPTRHKLRELTTAKIGTLIRISGQIVRTHPVHPELLIGTFKCLDCHAVIKNVEQQFKFTNPAICSNPVCANRRNFVLDVDNSTFVDFQKVRIQETQSELPKGCIPRSLEVILRAEVVETVQAGDRYDFTGALIVVPDVSVLALPGTKAEPNARNKIGDQGEGIRGLKALGVRDLSYKMAFLACSVTATSLRFGGTTDAGTEEMSPQMMKKTMTNEEWNKIYEMSKDRNLYQNLVSSLFPSIHGNDEVKKGVVLMLFGGVPKTTGEGTTLRGDINCCIVGDPSTAKSQLLKQVADITPRAIYTSGKASSAAGLTAAVVRDEESADFVIEAGALMLADNGICCIDEFDKMDPKDQVAIHEAMEQQTISIAKAGVRATLNARTSILAAANPIGGRYDRRKSLQENVELSAPIMSRFDLFFILVDECNELIDNAIARKIVDLHADNLIAVETLYTQEEIVRYINFAKFFKPRMEESAAKLLVEFYINMRKSGRGGGKSTWKVTVRQLESLIRLSEAFAKLECQDDVQEKHVQEAYRLLSKSIVRVEQPDIEFEDDSGSNGIDYNNQAPAAMEALNQNSSMENGHADENIPNGDGHTQKKKLSMSFEEYKKFSNSIIAFLKKEEERIENLATTDRVDHIRKSDVVAWYLDQIQDELESEEQIMERKYLIEKIIDRLLYNDQVLITLTKNTADEDDDPELIVHPNYVLEL